MRNRAGLFLRRLGVIGVLFAIAYAHAAELRVAETEAKRAAVDKPAPAYPLAAVQLKVTGTVNVEARVNVAGSVDEVNIVTGNAILTAPVVDAVRKWRFRPFQADGKPVAAIVSLSFEFNRR